MGSLKSNKMSSSKYDDLRISENWPIIGSGDALLFIWRQDITRTDADL